MDSAYVVNQSVAVADFMRDAKSKIYMLVSAGDVVYVGQSKNVNIRLNDHKTDGKVFDSVAVFDISQQEIVNEIEADLIVKLNPKLNKTIHPNKWIRRSFDGEPCFSRVVQRRSYSRDAEGWVFRDAVIDYGYVVSDASYELFDKDGNAYHVSPKHCMAKLNTTNKDK